MTDVPFGLSLSRPLDEAVERRAAARLFCLDVIKEFYGFDYRRDWHADLDSLVADASQCWFAPANLGAFWALRDGEDRLVATAGFYTLGWKPALAASFAGRYPAPAAIPQLVRVYVRADRRGRGIGGWLSALAEAQAREFGFERLYLHASSDTPATLAFWRSRGFVAFAAAEGTTHFDKMLPGPLYTG